ncbi:MAG TPA: 4-amino-4-deoxy-L-arabinose transferase [Nocardioides sp.]|nr:4-amino-4-deoxy-L-arabinose transferase [Nocardioides sp.]
MDRPSERVLALARARPPSLGSGRLVCVDGPSGSGKTTLASALAAPGVQVVHMDALYDGWGGLPTVAAQLASLLTPLASGAPGSYRRYDWEAGTYAETVVVPPSELLVVEGVGSWSPAFAPLVTVLVWVEAPATDRLARAISRDGAAYEHRLRQWARDEQDHFDRTGAREHADLVLGP